jgi:hypothetical protein
MYRYFAGSNARRKARDGRLPQAVGKMKAIRYGVTALSAFLALGLSMPQAMAQGCPLVAKPPVLAHETVSQAINGTFNPDEEINSIQVTVVTGTGLFSGTTDDVWFDLGPRAWKLGEKFEEGSTKNFGLNVYDPYFEGAGNGRLRIRDLIYARLEKKGICGLTNAPDSLLDLAFPGEPLRPIFCHPFGHSSNRREH